uniref:Uncharacterized protein n=1 Tax=Anguilla anguilla TaxID=7936 RepID=A0A0E9WHB4_ANGAN
MNAVEPTASRMGNSCWQKHKALLRVFGESRTHEHHKNDN